MSEAEKKGFIYHDMADLVEHNPMIVLLLEKSDLPSHLQDLQKADVL